MYMICLYKRLYATRKQFFILEIPAKILINDLDRIPEVTNNCGFKRSKIFLGSQQSINS